jgi:hypothetical protein
MNTALAPLIEFENPGLDPTDGDLARAEALLDGIAAIYGDAPILLSSRERARLAKPGAADEAMIPKIVEQGRRSGLGFSVDLDETLKQLERAQRLAPLRDRAALLAQITADAVRTARGQAWSGALIYYGMLKLAARTDPELALELEPIRAHFAARRAGRAKDGDSHKGAKTTKGKKSKSQDASEPTS